ncbi:hypothetical protein BC834DRAFT_827638 [Gloeopeniophorella convolvens]|nr:hypothetical protein BC834DRAFT_827638 [Gloeopeniophorella convolvens]
MTHVAEFFATYPDFNYNPDAPPTAEFRRMRQVFHWGNNNEEYIDAREAFSGALAEDFNEAFGTDVDNIDHWHELCQICRVDPIPEGIAACRKAVKSKHVNLVDLVYHEGQVRVFPSIKALAKYSRKAKKIFPLNEAKAGGILKYLLRPILGGRRR